MNNAKRVVQSALVLAVMWGASGCVVEGPREGYYDHDHNRYYHEHAWHDCGDHDDHCR